MQNPQLAFPLSVDDKASFDNFWPGRNEELLAALDACALHREPPLIYFYGKRASGKSHLLYAAMRQANKQKTNTSFLPLSDDYITPAMLDLVDVSQLVCVDDIHAWAGIRDYERALFSLFERIKSSGGRLIISAKSAVADHAWEIPDLRSRLASGLIYPLWGLDESEQLAMLAFRARHKGLEIGEEVLKFILRRRTRDTGELVELLDAIDRSAMIEKRRVTIPFLKQLFDKG